MGQHLHIYSSPEISLPEAAAWCEYRAWEHSRMPNPGFEETAWKKVEEVMHQRTRLGWTLIHFELPSTWHTTIWPRLWWSAYVVDGSLIARCREDLEYAMLRLPAMPGSGKEWMDDDIWDILHSLRGKVAWGNNDGI